MAEDTRDWEDPGPEDLQEYPPHIYDPLAELAVELALCSQAIEGGIGEFCDYCTCQLKYHLTITEGRFQGECEICGCDRPGKIPYNPLTRIIPVPRGRQRADSEYSLEMYEGKGTAERSRDARAALKELTE